MSFTIQCDSVLNWSFSLFMILFLSCVVLLCISHISLFSFYDTFIDLRTVIIFIKIWTPNFIQHARFFCFLFCIFIHDSYPCPVYAYHIYIVQDVILGIINKSLFHFLYFWNPIPPPTKWYSIKHCILRNMYWNLNAALKKCIQILNLLRIYSLLCQVTSKPTGRYIPESKFARSWTPCIIVIGSKWLIQLNFCKN